MDWYKKSKKIKGYLEQRALRFEYMRSPEWKEIKDSLFKLKDYKCEVCGSTSHLAAHHVDYDCLFREQPRDLIVLCRKCHQRITWIRRFSRMLQSRSFQVYLLSQGDSIFLEDFIKLCTRFVISRREVNPNSFNDIEIKDDQL